VKRLRRLSINVVTALLKMEKMVKDRNNATGLKTRPVRGPTTTLNMVNPSMGPMMVGIQADLSVRPTAARSKQDLLEPPKLPEFDPSQVNQVPTDGGCCTRHLYASHHLERLDCDRHASLIDLEPFILSPSRRYHN